MYRRGGNLTFATVDASGHFVPYDKPREALAMATSWLLGPADVFEKELRA